MTAPSILNHLKIAIAWASIVKLQRSSSYFHHIKLSVDFTSVVSKRTSHKVSFIYFHSFNTVAITEAWLPDYVLDNKILPSQYSTFRHDRPLHGGGVMLAANNTIPSKILPPQTLN